MIYIDDRINELDIASALEKVSQQRREQALRFKHEQGKRTCLSAYLLLKRGLLEEYGIKENPVFGYGEHGKPFLKDYPDIHFNFSHCSCAVACILSNRPVGIDVECVRTVSESVMRYAMNEEELASIRQSENPMLQFARLWTKKEAAVKLIGTGITDNLKTVLQTPGLVFETVECSERGYLYTVCRYQ
ncbi:MAG: 4'-phosphopantetheinyl transferase superfamily protein [Bacteroidaceae bacterium]|nr:4'-phosphopantetheinyl transferase superfamily protein [Bacteroidaceae bacterium]